MSRAIHPAVYELRWWAHRSLESISAMSWQLQQDLNSLPDRLLNVRSQAQSCQKLLDSLYESIHQLTTAGEGETYFGVEASLNDQEIESLVTLNKCLTNVEDVILRSRSKAVADMQARCANPEDSMYDYELEAVLSFHLNEDDSDYSAEEDNFIARRHEYITLEPCKWHEEYTVSYLPAVFSREKSCWLFHDLHSHDYDNVSRRLPLRDCLRVGLVCVDLHVIQQYKFPVSAEAVQP